MHLCRSLALLPLVMTAMAADPPPARVVGSEPYRWTNAVLGGIEGTRGIVVDAKHPEHLYVRADCGGIWKLDRASGAAHRWVSLSDAIPWKWNRYVTAPSLAIDCDDPRTLWTTAEGQPWDRLNIVMKTTDGGASWRPIPITRPDGTPVPLFHDDVLTSGEHLVSDPNLPRRLWLVTAEDGLWRSDDGGEHFAAVASFPTRGGKGGLAFVTLDWHAGTTGQATRDVFVGAFGGERDGVATGGVYASRDGGATWAKLEGGGGPGGGTTCVRGGIAADGALWVTGTGSPGGVWRWRAGAWADVTPPAERGKPFCAIAPHPTDARQVACGLTFDDGAKRQVYWSGDDGATWTLYRHTKGWTPAADDTLRIVGQPRWHEPQLGGMQTDLAFDPLHPEELLEVSFQGVHVGTGAGSPTMTFRFVGEGREQITCGDVVSPTTGAPLIIGVWDMGGFRKTDLDAIPEHGLKLLDRDGGWRPDWEHTFQDVFDLDASPAHGRIVAAGGWQWNMTGDAAYSDDNGETFRRFPTKPFPDAKFGRIAVARDPDHVVWMPMGGGAWWTHDGGRTWAKSRDVADELINTNGPWSFFRCLAADRVAPDTLYLYDRHGGDVLRSTDGGESFARVAQLPKQTYNHFDNHALRADPYHAGELWAAIMEQGLFHSLDGGATWTRIPGIEWVVGMNLGCAKPGSDVASLYVFGQIGGAHPAGESEVDAALYRSDDRGATWVRISDDAHRLATINGLAITGCMQRWGRVYIATGSRGVFVATPER